MKSSSYAIIYIVAFIVLLLHSHNVNGSSNNINCSGENNLREGWFEYYSDNESFEGSYKLAELKSTGNLEIPTLQKKINKIYSDEYKGKKISDGKDKSYIWNE